MSQIKKLYGGINMKWLTVILYAIGTAAITAAFLVIPIFEGTSFERMGITLESWIFFAVILMSNCKKPLESAIKTFVFFLISQPLIYLFQVPFTPDRWSLFNYYGRWFVATLLTFPMAFIGWYIVKKNWVSVLIFTPVLAFLGYSVYLGLDSCIPHFPHYLVMTIFCLLQIVLYVLLFTENKWQKIVGFLIPIITIIILLIAIPKVDTTVTTDLPGDMTFSENATLTILDSSFVDVQLVDPVEGIIEAYAHDYGETTITITDGDKEYTYTLTVYDDDGTDKIDIN